MTPNDTIQKFNIFEQNEQECDIFSMSMTVCIAALADGGKKVFLVADTMLTAPAFGAYELEPKEGNKIVEIKKNIYVLCSGDLATSLAIVSKFKSSVEKRNLGSVLEYTQALKKEVEDYYTTWLETSILKPRGLTTLKDYYSRHNTIQNSLTTTIENEIRNAKNNFTKAMNFIVAGKAGDLCSLFLVVPNNEVGAESGTGFLSSGTGNQIAGYVLLDNEYNKSLSLEEVKKKVLFAKKKSEKVQGVGKETQEIIIE